MEKNGQAETKSIQEKLQEEIQIKLQEKVEEIRNKMFGGFKFVLNQLQNSFPGVTIPNMFSMSIPIINEDIDARSCATTHHVIHIEKEAR